MLLVPSILILVYIYTFYFAFLAVMKLKSDWDNLPIEMKVLVSPGVIVAIAMDISINILVSIVFFELPKEWTLTARLSRYKSGTAGATRQKVAVYLCTTFLDPAEFGGHCK